MNSREKILKAVQTVQTEVVPLPVLPVFTTWFDDPVAQFTTVLSQIGATVITLPSMETVPEALLSLYPGAGRVVSNIAALSGCGEQVTGLELPHTFENVDVAILQGQFGVAENGAVWLTEADVSVRALPFITQNLVLVLRRTDIVPLMHDAYARIGQAAYAYGAFIAGPSKTADIEQSLVLGAHGPKAMSLFLLDQ